MFPKSVSNAVLIAVLITLAGSVAVRSQTKKNRNTKQTSPATAAVAPKVEASGPGGPPPVPAAKRNLRPTAEADQVPISGQQKSGPAYRYEFTQPDFINSRILIEHDDDGKGTISFQRRGYSDLFTERLNLSETALAKLKSAFTELNFLDSTENYQHEKDFSNMGNSRIELVHGQKKRAVTINYTINKSARVLMDEYRKIANQALWIFDVTIARENQPLDGPSQMDALDALMKRNEISDPRQLVPFLRELSDDERLPLMARNHATRIIQQIEKSKK